MGQSGFEKNRPRTRRGINCTPSSTPAHTYLREERVLPYKGLNGDVRPARVCLSGFLS